MDREEELALKGPMTTRWRRVYIDRRNTPKESISTSISGQSAICLVWDPLSELDLVIVRRTPKANRSPWSTRWFAANDIA